MDCSRRREPLPELLPPREEEFINQALAWDKRERELLAELAAANARAGAVERALKQQAEMHQAACDISLARVAELEATIAGQNTFCETMQDDRNCFQARVAELEALVETLRKTLDDLQVDSHERAVLDAMGNARIYELRPGEWRMAEPREEGALCEAELARRAAKEGT